MNFRSICKHIEIKSPARARMHSQRILFCSFFGSLLCLLSCFDSTSTSCRYEKLILFHHPIIVVVVVYQSLFASVGLAVLISCFSIFPVCFDRWRMNVLPVQTHINHLFLLLMTSTVRRCFIHVRLLLLLVSRLYHHQPDRSVTVAAAAANFIFNLNQ